MTATSESTTARELFEEIAERLAAEPGVTRSTMFGSRGLRVKGQVFAMCWKDSLVVKLPVARVDEAVASGAGVRFEPSMGRAMKEWVGFGPTTADEWLTLAAEARAFVAVAA